MEGIYRTILPVPAAAQRRLLADIRRHAVITLDWRGLHMAEIADKLRVHKSTISRDLARI